MLLAVAVALVLADSSVVILALPDILREFDLEIRSVSYVLTFFNGVLAVAAVPAALLSRRFSAARVFGAGVVLFAGASIGCAVAGSIDLLVGARCVQALAGAAIVCSALVLLRETSGSEHDAARIWAAAGVVGAAVGPAVGGLLTQVIAWQAVFVVQAPIALAVLPAIRGHRAGAGPATATAKTRPNVAAQLALGVLSASLIAALFLIVLLIVDGWGQTPLTAAVAVSVMPLAAFASGRLVHARMAPRPRALAGLLLIAGGTASLSLLPHARVWWTIAPQVLIGLGLGLAVTALTEAALTHRQPQILHAGWTIAARHAGIVLGIVLLTPVFTADLGRAQRSAEEAGTARLLDAAIPVQLKVALGEDLVTDIQAADGRLPDIAPAFARNRPATADRPAYARLERAIVDEVERAGTHAFSRSFEIAAILALLALVPAIWAREPDPA